jgi:hypothetical protein
MSTEKNKQSNEAPPSLTSNEAVTNIIPANTILFAGGTTYGFKEGASSIVIDKVNDDDVTITLNLKLLENLKNIVINSDEIKKGAHYETPDDVNNFVYLLNKKDDKVPIIIDINFGEFSIIQTRENKTRFTISGFVNNGGKTQHGTKTQHGVSATETIPTT